MIIYLPVDAGMYKIQNLLMYSNQAKHHNKLFIYSDHICRGVQLQNVQHYYRIFFMITTGVYNKYTQRTFRNNFKYSQNIRKKQDKDTNVRFYF